MKSKATFQIKMSSILIEWRNVFSSQSIRLTYNSISYKWKKKFMKIVGIWIIFYYKYIIKFETTEYERYSNKWYKCHKSHFKYWI